jgi:PAS domain S-box-containing protein
LSNVYELRAILDQAPIGIVIRRGAEIVYANRAVAAAIDLPDEAALLGRDLAQLFDADVRDLLWQRFRAADGSVPEPPALARFTRCDGRPGVMELTASGVVRFRGVRAVLVLLRDVTGEKQLRERMDMSHRLAAAGALAQTVAHEINNPLACVTANLDMLDEELRALTPGDVPAALRDLLTDAREGAERVRLIVRDLRQMVAAPARR